MDTSILAFLLLAILQATFGAEFKATIGNKIVTIPILTLLLENWEKSKLIVCLLFESNVARKFNRNATIFYFLYVPFSSIT